MAVIRRKKRKVSESPVAKSVATVLEDARNAGLQLLPFDVEGLLDLYGILVSYENMDDLSGYVEKRGSTWVLGVNLYHSRRRKRFTMAHELGHICLHAQVLEGQKRREEQIFFRSKLTNDIEKEANMFASNLLIPKDLLFAQINDGKKRLSELSDIFDVSLDAMRYKAYKLGLISEY